MQTRPGNQEQIANHQPFYKKIIFHTVQSKIDISEAHYPHLVFYLFWKSKRWLKTEYTIYQNYPLYGCN